MLPVVSAGSRKGRRSQRGPAAVCVARRSAQRCWQLILAALPLEWAGCVSRRVSCAGCVARRGQGRGAAGHTAGRSHPASAASGPAVRGWEGPTQASWRCLQVAPVGGPTKEQWWLPLQPFPSSAQVRLPQCVPCTSRAASPAPAPRACPRASLHQPSKGASGFSGSFRFTWTARIPTDSCSQILWELPFPGLGLWAGSSWVGLRPLSPWGGGAGGGSSAAPPPWQCSTAVCRCGTSPSRLCACRPRRGFSLYPQT